MDIETANRPSTCPTVEEGDQENLNTCITGQFHDLKAQSREQQSSWIFTCRCVGVIFLFAILVWTRQLSQQHMILTDVPPKVGIVVETGNINYSSISNVLPDSDHGLSHEQEPDMVESVSEPQEIEYWNQSNHPSPDIVSTENPEINLSLTMRNDDNLVLSSYENGNWTVPIDNRDDDNVGNETESSLGDFMGPDNHAETFSSSSVLSTPQDPYHDQSTIFTEQDYKIHVVYDDWKYRRVCALVGTMSHLCMTVRYPFPVEPMDLSVAYAYPTETRWYTTHKSPTILILDGTALEECEQMSVKDCLDYHFDHRHPLENENIVLAIYTRTFDGRTSLYGTTTTQQRKRFQSFFRNQVVIVFGASPSSPITECMKTLFGPHCEGTVLRIPHIANCTISGNEEDWIVLGQESFYPLDINHGRTHSVTPGTSVNDRLFLVRDKLNMTLDTSKPLKFTVIIEHPIAHTQNQPMMEQYWEDVVKMQDQWTHVFLDSLEEGLLKEELTHQGIEISNIIAFDGSPQFFPSESGGFIHELESFVDEQDFRNKSGYQGWDSKYGSTCSGPLHPSSNLTILNDLARSAYQQNGLDMRWYGRAWEFMNLVWFDVKGWDIKGLDCTHTGKPTGALSCMHKYFLMAMVDDHFDVLEKQQR